MARYIDADELTKEIKSLQISCGGKNTFPDTVKESILRIINEQPTADVAEVKHIAGVGKMAERQRKEK